MSGGLSGRTETPFFSLLVQSGLLAVYGGALMSVTGWAYADAYFAAFGISAAGLDRNIDGSLTIYALWALRDGWAFVLAGLGVLAAVAIVLFLFHRAGRSVRPFAAALIAAAVLASFPGAYRLGQWRADAQVPGLIALGYHTFPRVAVTAKTGTATADFLAAKNAGEQKDCLRKLYMDGKNLYLYPGYESFKESIPPVYIVPLSELAAIEIVKNRGLCKP